MRHSRARDPQHLHEINIPITPFRIYARVQQISSTDRGTVTFMNTRTLQIGAIVIGITALAAVAVFGGLGSGSGTPSDASTALGSLEVAESALSTTVPDARLLIVQMMASSTPTGTPQWAYLFGSPSTDMAYLVYTTDGEIMTSMEYGSVGLSADEWADVPETKAWRIDSDAAYEKALAVSGATGDPAGYFMGLMMYKTAEDTSTVEPLQWNVWFDPGASGATTNLILVDATSGETEVTESP